MANKYYTSRIDIRVSAEEKVQCEHRAREAGYTLSQWIRQRLLLDASRPADKITDKCDE